MAIRLRELTAEERSQVERLAASRTSPARAVERARIVRLAAEGHRAPEVAARLGLHPQTARDWLARFNAEGLAGLEDRSRPGKPPTYTPEQVGQVVAAALSDPQDLGLPFACWTLDRLVVYLGESQGVAIKRSRISEVLIAEGLRWRQQETWFGQKVDPAFAEKRGASRPSTPPRRRAASSSA